MGDLRIVQYDQGSALDNPSPQRPDMQRWLDENMSRGQDLNIKKRSRFLLLSACVHAWLFN